VLPRPEPRVPRASWVYRLCAWVAFTIFRMQRWRYDVKGVDHVPTSGGAVIAANHFSFWDFFLVGKGPYHRYGRPVRILAKESLFRVPVFGWLMRRAEHIPVHRGAGAQAFQSAIDALKRGELVLVLPEGTVSPAYELLPFRAGAARMAQWAQVPLIPAASWGSHRFHSVGHHPRWSWRLPVSIRYGQPLQVGPDDDPVEVTVRLQAAVEAMVDDLAVTYPDGTPEGAWWVPARHGGGAPTVEEADAYLQRLRDGWKQSKAS
jgi:1-acyl-sn-glycerol-3-phosphate acyltransferase